MLHMKKNIEKLRGLEAKVAKLNDDAITKRKAEGSKEKAIVAENKNETFTIFIYIILKDAFTGA